ncbi:MAG TPA: hypothetical protein VGP82_21405 [Ktedonobacterales bacterium]|jgi:hypothetical protein|nr:hypothetical protein [Ktedonobacterales bacterium]
MSAQPIEDGPGTPLQSFRRIFMRAVWVMLALFGVGSFVARLPSHFADLQQVCTSQICSYGQVDAEAVGAFQALGLSLETLALSRISLTILAALIWFAVATVLAWRKSEDVLSLLVALWLVFVGAATITGAYGLGFGATVQAHDLSALAVNYSAELGSLLLVFLLFPAARSVRSGAFWLLNALGFFVLVPRLLSGTPLSLILYAALTGLAVVQLYRYWRVTGPIERQQTKWVALGISVFTALAAILLVPVRLMPAWGQPASFYNAFHTTVLIVAGILPSGAIAVAILRYRLWDIDLLISTALVYGSLTGLLVAIYAGLIVGLDSLVLALTGQASQPVAIVVATLAIAGLFRPLRQRVQHGIDRRFYRRKYDAAKTLAAFSLTLRADIDLSDLREHVLTVVDETMQPAHASLWLLPDRGRRRTDGTL